MKDAILERQFFLAYSDIYEDFDSFNIKSILRSIPKITAIERISYLLCQLSLPGETTKKTHASILLQWVLLLASEDNKRVSKVIRERSLHEDPKFHFIDATSSLMLIEYLLEDNNFIEDKLSAEQESDLFKAYLWCIETSIRKQQAAFNCDDNDSIDDLVRKMLPAKLSFREIDSFKDYRIQFIKTFYFFSFCETDVEYKEYLLLFLREYNVATWDKYLLNLITFYLTLLQQDIQLTPKLCAPNLNKQTADFLDAFCLNEHRNYKRSDDFTELRNTPIYKYENYYLFLYFNFFVDKIYQGFLFDFAKVLSKNKCRIKDFGDLKSDLGEKFAEHFAFYKTIDLCFKNYADIQLKGENIKIILKEGEPDFYMRQGNKVFLFEFKDPTLNKKTKHSGDFEEIKRCILEKFEETSSDKKKGIKQLVNTIKQIQNLQYNRSELDEFIPNKIVIYPILVHTDCSFEVEGINYILKERFKQLLIEGNIKNHHQIKDVVLINLDTLISLQDLFQSNKLKISTCINEYLNYSSDNKKIINRIYSFDYYIRYYAFNKGFKNLAPIEFRKIVDGFVEKEKQIKLKSIL